MPLCCAIWCQMPTYHTYGGYLRHLVPNATYMLNIWYVPGPGADRCSVVWFVNGFREHRRSNPLAALRLLVFRTMLGLGYPQLVHSGGPHGATWDHVGPHVLYWCSLEIQLIWCCLKGGVIAICCYPVQYDWKRAWVDDINAFVRPAYGKHNTPRGNSWNHFLYKMWKDICVSYQQNASLDCAPAEYAITARGWGRGSAGGTPAHSNLIWP